MKLSTAAILGLTFVTLGACSRTPASDSPASTPAAQPAAAPADGVRVVKGTVVETMNAASYTYVRVKTDREEVWAATGQFKVAVGDRVSVPLQMAMTDFRSPTLKRTFPVIYFVTEITRDGQTAASEQRPSAAMMAAHGSDTPAAGASMPPAKEEVHGPATPMAPPAGGMTIADVWAKRASLAGKSVTVHGKVVKFNGGILDRNWLHIQDGSGDAKSGSNDLTITSQGLARVGDLVTATGKVTVDKDFGAGYAYKVMLEGATVAVK